MHDRQMSPLRINTASNHFNIFKACTLSVNHNPAPRRDTFKVFAEDSRDMAPFQPANWTACAADSDRPPAQERGCPV